MHQPQPPSPTPTITPLRFHSDEALTRRGFWLEVRVAAAARLCPADHLLLGDRCLKAYAEPLTWYEAHSYCAAMGHSLAPLDHFALDRQLSAALAATHT